MTPVVCKRARLVVVLAGVLVLPFVASGLPGVMVGWGLNNNGQAVPSIPMTNLVAVAAGSSHSLGLTTEGTVVGWGDNSFQQCVSPAGLSNVIAIAAGSLHSLALKTDGTVSAWGGNSSGQSSIPAGLNEVKAIAAGGLVSMALRSNGTVLVWGETTYQQTLVPASATNLVAIAAGGLHCLGLRSNGTVVAWGDNTSSRATVPSSASNVIAIAAGQNHSLALRSNGTVVSWGFSPIAVPSSVTNAVAIGAGFAHSIARRSTGGLVAWGNNTHGQTTVPAGLTNAVSIAAGGNHNLALVSAPYVVTQPQNLTVNEGSNAEFSVSVLGSAPLRYQWLFNAAPITGATNATLALTNVQADQAGNYSVWISNTWGQVLSSTAVLKIGPVITEQPQGLSVSPGANPIFSVTAVSSFSLTYQWQFNGAYLPGETGSSLSLTNVQAENGGNYDVIVSIPTGSVTSSPALLTVNTTCLPVPNDLIGWWRAESNTLNFASEAHGTFTGNFYQTGKVGHAFYVNPGSQQVTVADRPILNPTNAITIEAWVLITNAPFPGMSIVTKGDGNESSQYGISKVFDGRFYGVIATDLGGAVAYGTTRAQSNRWYHVAATYDPNYICLYVNGRLEATNPANGPISVTSYPVLIGVNYTGLVDEPSIYNRALDAAEISAIYNSDASGKCTVPSSPIILTAPQSQIVVAGSDVALPVVARGTPPLYYQWRFNESDIAGAIGSQLSLTNAQMIHDGNYRVVISNAYGAVTSSPIALSVQVSLPVITRQPADRLGLEGQMAALDIGYWGSQPLAIQWHFNGAILPGATNAVVRWINLNLTNDGNYWVTLSNAHGSVTSSIARLTVLPTPPPAPALIGWGDNAYGQLNFSARTTNIVSISASDKTTLAVRADGVIVASSEPIEGPTLAEGLSNNVVAVQASDWFTLALRTDGRVSAWGANPNGELNVPADLSNVVAIAAGKYTANALQRDGTVVGWGSGGPPPPGLSNVVAITSGLNTKLAVKSDGTVVGWNFHSFESQVPAGLSGVKAVAAGSGHCLALRSNGTVVAWGDNTSGQTNIPPGLSDVTAIAAGAIHSVALRSNGMVVCWGATNFGQCAVPPGLSNVVAIAAGDYFTIAATPGPSIYSHPTSATVMLGANVTFTVSAAGVTPLSYQWRLQGTNLPGQTNAVLAINNVQTNQAGAYSVRVSNPYGFTDSSSANLVVNLPAPADGGIIVDNPAAVVIGVWQANVAGPRYGTNFLTKGQGSGSGKVTFTPVLPLSGGYHVYEWHPQLGVNAALHHIAFDGGQQSILVNQTINGGKWNLLGTFKFGSGTNGSVTISDLFAQPISSFVVADAMSFVYVSPPVITSQPLSLTADPGAVAQFNVGATSQTPLSYQWRFGNVDIPEATNGTLAVSNLQSSHAGDYQVAVSNISGTVWSDIARLKVGGQLNYIVTGSQFHLSWSGPYVLQSSTNVTGPYVDLPAISPYPVSPNGGPSRFYRLRFNPSP